MHQLLEPRQCDKYNRNELASLLNEQCANEGVKRNGGQDNCVNHKSYSCAGAAPLRIDRALADPIKASSHAFGARRW
ncbi:MAG: hypothetical protein EB015_15785 [Methylocystaceae bacterium]|nr:hypothetical protein [Methylocystaceae bacterium]